MSLTLSLASAALLIGSTVSSTALLQILGTRTDKIPDSPAIPQNQIITVPTQFVDAELLLETLQAHSCGVNQVSENEFLVQTENGFLRYVRNSPAEAFTLEITHTGNTDALFEELRSFENEYGRNVQTYTYNHIKENLSEGMKIESEEILDDDSLLITIDI